MDGYGPHFQVWLLPQGTSSLLGYAPEAVGLTPPPPKTYVFDVGRGRGKGVRPGLSRPSDGIFSHPPLHF